MFTDKNDCDPNPCKNGAICNDLIGDYTCECVSGWEGKDCDIGKHHYFTKLLIRLDLFSLEGIDILRFYYVSIYIDHDECKPNNPCQNDGICTDEVPPGGHTCNCTTGWEGENCEIGKCYLFHHEKF